MATTAQNTSSRPWSFLDSVPPEIRIRIYEVAFDVEKAVLIKHFSADKKDGRPRNAFPRLAAYDTQSCMIPCISLLRCCRATYNEGIAALLSCKQIIFSNDRWSLTFRKYDHTQFVRVWLDELSPLVPSFRKVVIDISINSRSRRLMNPDEIDILPLLGIMFSQPGKPLQIEFTKTKPAPPLQAPAPRSRRMSVRDIIGWASCYFKVANLNQALISITKRDVLDLRKFQDLPRFLSAVFVNSCGNEGKIVLRSLSGMPKSEIPFLILDQGRTLCKKRDHGLAELPYFPPDRMDIMYDRMIRAPEDIVLDLDTLSNSPFIVPNKYSDSITPPSSDAYLCYLQNNFKFIMAFTGKHGTRLSSLSRWLKRQSLEISGPALVPAQLTESSSAKKANTRLLKRAAKKYRRRTANMDEDEFWRYNWRRTEVEKKKKETQATARKDAAQDLWTLLRWMKAVNFEFHFSGRRRTTMEDLRINVTNFLQTTTGEEPFTATIKCTLRSPRKGGQIAYYEDTFTLRHVQLNAFIILSHLLKSNAARPKLPCPNIYINGLGLAVAIVHSYIRETSGYAGVVCDISTPKNAEDKGKHYARWLKHLVPMGDLIYPEETEDELRPEGSLIRLWDDLRIALWGEGLRATW